MIEASDIVVSQHAVERYRMRRLGKRDRRPFLKIVLEIEGLIREALAANRVFNHKPKDFGLYGQRRLQFPPNEHFILCGDVGFILEEKPSGHRVVRTALTRTGGTPR